MSDSKVLVAYPTAEFARHAVFYDYFNRLDKPIGTIIAGAHGQSPARNRNLLIRMALEQGCTHILFLDDDTAFPHDMLTKLLAHDLDIVSGFYLMRSFPHKPIVFKQFDEIGKVKHYYPEDNGLHEVACVGLGACLIKVDVFKKLEYPWIRLGEIETDHWSDDTGFFKRVREAGIKIYCDFSICVGHLASVTVIPVFKDGVWTIALDTYGTQSVSIPMGLEK
jgi:hypothetical protein